MASSAADATYDNAIYSRPNLPKIIPPKLTTNADIIVMIARGFILLSNIANMPFALKIDRKTLPTDAMCSIDMLSCDTPWYAGSCGMTKLTTKAAITEAKMVTVTTLR